MRNVKALVAAVRRYFSAQELERERRALVAELRALDRLRVYQYPGEQRAVTRLAQLPLLDQ